MKKLLLACLLLALALTMAACSDDAEPTDGTGTEPDTAVTSADDTTDAPTEPGTAAPTEAPTETPTEAPTETPTEAPTEAATEPGDAVYAFYDAEAMYASMSVDAVRSVNEAGVQTDYFNPFDPNEKMAVQTSTIELMDDTVQLELFGWVGMTEEYEAIGYMIDRQAPVFDDNFPFAPEQGVLDAAAAAGGITATRFDIFADITGLEPGEHCLSAVYRLADGNTVWFFQQYFNVR